MARGFSSTRRWSDGIAISTSATSDALIHQTVAALARGTSSTRRTSSLRPCQLSVGAPASAPAPPCHLSPSAGPNHLHVGFLGPPTSCCHTQVGYGDLSPSSDDSRLFTAVYILLGVGVIFTLAGAVVDDAFLGLEQGMYTCASRLLEAGRNATLRYRRRARRPIVTSRPQAHLSAEVPTAILHYLRHLGFTVAVGLSVTQLLSAWIFTR